MANKISGLDAAWAFPDYEGLKAFKAQGGVAVAGYLSYTPSKDWTPGRLRNVHHLGLGAIMNFESTADRALSGYSAGLYDGQAAWDQIAALHREVGYGPKSKIHLYCSADFDATSSQCVTVDHYLMGVAHGLLLKHANADQAVYGSYKLVVHTAKAGTSKAEWQTYAWSGGQFYTGTEFYQWSNSHGRFGGDADYDQVIDAEHLGAWWPPGSKYDVASTVSSASSKSAPKPAPKPEVLTLQGAPSTYKQFLADVRKASIDTPVYSWRDNRKKEHALDTVVRWAVQDELKPLTELVAGVAKVQAATLTRVAAAQAAIAKVRPTTVVTNVAASGAAIAAAVKSEMDKITWKAS